MTDLPYSAATSETNNKRSRWNLGERAESVRNDGAVDFDKRI